LNFVREVSPALTLPLSFDPEALDGKGRREGGGDSFWLRRSRTLLFCGGRI
jgi:hypothetical protein